MSYNPNSTGQKLSLDGSVSGSVTFHAAISTSSYDIFWPSAQGSASTTLINDGSGNLTWGAGGSGVSSVGLSLPASLFSVSGSPVTSSGTLTGSLITQSANLIWAGPFSGSAATPTFRSLVLADIPNLSSLYLSSSGGTISGGLVVTGTIGASNFSGSSSGTNTGDQTNITGNAATVTTNANLTGVVTSIGNATSIANGAITNAMLATSYNVNTFTLSSGDITNGFVTLSSSPDVPSATILNVIGGPAQSYGSDFIVSSSQLTFLGDLALGGNAALVSGDKLIVQYN